MKKAVSYIVIGACLYAGCDLYLNNRNKLCRNIKKLKKNGMETVNKVKSLF